MSFRLPPLNALRIFEVAARHPSFKDASDELHVTASAVSHAIQTLENWLGTKLFDRSGRSLKLTRAAESYVPMIREALIGLSSATADLPGRKPTGALAISCAPTFAARWLLPRLPRFSARCPEVIVSIDTSTRTMELAASSIDIAIRMGSNKKATSNWTRLFSEILIPVCAPKVREKMGRQVDLLTAVPLIHVTTVSTDWAEWFRGTGREEPSSVADGLYVDTVHMALDAAAEGLGIALGRPPFTDDDIASGRLIRADECAVQSGISYWLVVPDHNLEKPEVKMFRRWLLDELSATKPIELQPASIAR